MFIGKLARAVLKIIMPDILEHMMKVFKSDKVLAYMELENDADRGVKVLKQEMDMVKDELKTMAKDVPPAIDKKEWEEMKKFMDKVKNKSIWKKIKNG